MNPNAATCLWAARSVDFASEDIAVSTTTANPLASVINGLKALTREAISTRSPEHFETLEQQRDADLRPLNGCLREREDRPFSVAGANAKVLGF